MPLNSDLVGTLFDYMEVPNKKVAASPEKLNALRKKAPSSFVDSKWLHPEPLKTAPWVHQETAVGDKQNYEALGQWSNLSSESKKEHLKRVGDLLSSRAAEIAEFEVSLYGAPSDLILKEVLPFLANYWNYYSGWAALEDSQNRQFYASGVVEIDVRSSKFPLLEAVLACAPALAAGCVVTVFGSKRFESFLFLASISGLPPGVLNVLATSSTTVTETGLTQATFGPIRSVKESPNFLNWDSIFHFSGRSCMVVLSYADFEGAARSLLEDATKRANYSLWPVSEVLIQEHLFQPFIDFFEKIMPKSPCNGNRWPESVIGPVRKFAKDEGLKLLESGEALVLVNGRYEEVGSSSAIEEGPFVVGLLPVRSINEALSIINSRPRTLSASVWSQDGILAKQAVQGLKVPLVWINQHGIIPAPSIGLGSTRYSGGGQWGRINGMLNFKQWRPTVCDKGAHRHVTKWSEEGGAGLQKLDMLIEGRLVQSAAYQVLIGKTDKPVASVNIPTSKEVASAVSAGLKASMSWAALSQSARASALAKLRAALAKSEPGYAQLLSNYVAETAEKQASYEIKAATEALDKWCAKGVTNQVLQSQVEGSSTSHQVPVGVVAICGPIDGLGPLISLVGAALMAGNTVVVSASPREPLAALHLAQVGAALPAGVLGVVGPGAETQLAANSDVAALWIGFRSTCAVNSELPKRSWRIDYACLENCPDSFIVYQATNLKTICSAE